MDGANSLVHKLNNSGIENGVYCRSPQKSVETPASKFEPLVASLSNKLSLLTKPRLSPTIFFIAFSKKIFSPILEVLRISGKGFVILTSDHNFSFSLVYHNLMETSNRELLYKHFVENHTCCFLSDSKLVFHLRFSLLKKVYTLFCHFPFSLFNPRIFVRCHCRPV